MTKVAMMFVAMLALAVPAGAQDVKELGWTEFIDNIKFSELSDGSWEFTHENQPIHHYTVVDAPTGVMSVRMFFRLGSDDNNFSLYLAAIDPATATEIGTAAGVEKHEVNIRVMFTCRLETDGECRQSLGQLLRSGAEMQSLGPTDRGYEKSGQMPDGLTLSFLVNSSGRFSR